MGSSKTRGGVRRASVVPPWSTGWRREASRVPQTSATPTAGTAIRRTRMDVRCVSVTSRRRFVERRCAGWLVQEDSRRIVEAATSVSVSHLPRKADVIKGAVVTKVVENITVVVESIMEVENTTGEKQRQPVQLSCRLMGTHVSRRDPERRRPVQRSTVAWIASTAPRTRSAANSAPVPHAGSQSGVLNLPVVSTGVDG